MKHWFDNYINKMSDKDVEESKIVHRCPQCRKEKLIQEFVIPAWWEGYQIWREICHSCHIENSMKKLKKVIEKIPKKFPGIKIKTSILTPTGSYEMETKKEIPKL
jgi:hypothetical protein